MTMRRIALIALLILLAAVASPAFAHGSDVAADFNNDGFADLAVGVPGENGSAGAVNVLYGSAGGLSGARSQVFFQVGGAVEAGDQFGFALAAGDFNNDDFADLAVGAPFEVAGRARAAGAVSVLYGSPNGLSTSGGRLFTQVAGAVEALDNFGWALAAGDFNNNGFADLAVGAPGETAGSAEGAGAVSVLYGSAGGLSTSGGRLFTQVAGAVEGNDHFGFALAAGDFNNNGFADLAAGAPFEAVGRVGDAGAVSVLYGAAGGLTTAGGRLFTQVGGTVEAFDWFGWSLTAGDFNDNGFADLAVGAPLEGVAGAGDYAGAVSVLYGSAGGLSTSGGRLFTQVGSTPEGFDEFGAELAAGDFDSNGFADLAAAAPNEPVGGAGDAGAVSVLHGAGGGLTASGGQLFNQNSPGVPGQAETGDHFGGLDISFG
jgi:FG-GAP repeat